MKNYVKKALRWYCTASAQIYVHENHLEGRTDVYGSRL